MMQTSGFVRFVFGLARGYMPASAMKVPAHYSKEDADFRFRSLQMLVGGAMVAVGTLLVLGTFEALVHFNRSLSAEDGPGAYTIGPQGAIWWFFPAFVALCLSWEVTLRLWGVMGSRSEVEKYNYWTAQGIGFDCSRLLRWSALVIVLPIGVLTFLALPMHTVLRQDDIRNCGYAFGRCQVYRYADARQMTEIQGSRLRDGSLQKRAGIVIDFADGRRWSSADVGDFHDSVDPGFEQFLEEKTHLPLYRATTAADIPPL